MPNTNIVTDCFKKKINVPLIENGTNYIVLLTDYTEETQVTSNAGSLANIAAVEFFKYYFPEFWYPLIDPTSFASDMGTLPNSAALISAAETNAQLINQIILL